MQTFPSAVRAPATVGNETKLGEVYWRDSATGLSGECMIRLPRCTIGSHPSCTIVLPENIAAATHLTLTFGKRFTLLKAPYPTRIQGRLVREWLIDAPIEFCIGTCAFQVVPSAVALKSTSLVRADQLVAAANRLSEPLPPSPLSRSSSTSGDLGSPGTMPDRALSIGDFEKTLSRFDSIETSLDELRSSLGQIRESVAKVPIYSSDVTASLAEEFSQLSQNLTLQISTELRSQLEHRLAEQDGGWNEALKSGVKVLESRIQNLALKVESIGEMQGNLEETAMNAELRQTTSMEERFAGVEFRLEEIASRFVESSNSETAAVSNVQEDWKAEFENRFQELRIHRNEIYEALESVRNEVQQFGSVAQNNFEFLLQQLHAIPSRETPLAAGESDRYEFSTMDEPSNELTPSSQFTARAENDSQQAPEQAYHPFTNPAYHDADPAYQEIERDDVAVESSETSARDSFVQPNLEEEYSGLYDYPSRIAEIGSASEMEELSPNGKSPSGTEVEPSYQVDESVEEDSSVDIDALSERLRRMLSNSAGRSDSHGSGSGSHEQTAPGISSQSETSSLSRLYQNERDSLGSEPSEANTSRRSLLLEQFQYEETDSVPPSLVDDSVIHPRPTFDKAALHEDVSIESQDHFERFEPSDENDRQSYEQESSALTSHEESTYESPLLSGHHSASREAVPQPALGSSEEAEEEDSIEVYMQKLLQRVKGGHETVSVPAPSSPADSRMAPRSRSEALNRGNREAHAVVTPVEASPQKTTMMTADEFVPRQQIPEKKNELDALRELANSNARRAITKSDSRKMNSAILLKIAITAFALASALTLFIINRIQWNPPFVGMIAALIVAILWGVDCLKHFRLLGTVKASETDENDRSAAVQQKNTQEQWRPKAD